MEIDENELRNLQAQVGHLKNYETVFNALKGHPEAKKLLHAGIKKVSPNTAIPEFDASTAFHGAAARLEKEVIEPRMKKLDEFLDSQTKQRMDSDINSRIERGHQYLRSRNYGKDGIVAVEKMMQERGIGDYEAAEALFTRMNPPEEMATPGSAFDVFAGTQENSEDEFKRWAAGPKGREGSAAASQEVRTILKEIRGGRAA